MLSAFSYPFATLFAEPPRNGITRPKTVRGSGVKMVNMGEIFDHPRLNNVPMERVPLNRFERSRPGPPCGLHLRWQRFSTVDFVNYTDQTSTGTNMPRTSWKTMGGYPLCLPPEALARAFQSVTSPIMGRIVANVHSNLTLEALRDALLTSHGSRLELGSL